MYHLKKKKETVLRKYKTPNEQNGQTGRVKFHQKMTPQFLQNAPDVDVRPCHGHVTLLAASTSQSSVFIFQFKSHSRPVLQFVLQAPEQGSHVLVKVPRSLLLICEQTQQGYIILIYYHHTEIIRIKRSGAATINDQSAGCWIQSRPLRQLINLFSQFFKKKH